MSFYFATLLVLPLCVEGVEKNCTVGDRVYKSGSYFRHQVHFNATCIDGQIKVVNCLTQRGTKVPLGTLHFFEDGNCLKIGSINNFQLRF